MIMDRGRGEVKRPRRRCIGTQSGLDEENPEFHDYLLVLFALSPSVPRYTVFAFLFRSTTTPVHAFRVSFKHPETASRESRGFSFVLVAISHCLHSFPSSPEHTAFPYLYRLSRSFEDLSFSSRARATSLCNFSRTRRGHQLHSRRVIVFSVYLRALLLTSRRHPVPSSQIFDARFNEKGTAITELFCVTLVLKDVHPRQISRIHETDSGRKKKRECASPYRGEFRDHRFID